MDVRYSDYDNMIIDNVKIDVDTDQYIIMSPKEKKVIIDEEERLETYLEIKTIDDRMVYEMVQELNNKELASLIRMLQKMNQQLLSNTSSKGNCIK